MARKVRLKPAVRGTTGPLQRVVALGLLAALLIAPRLWFHHPFFGPLPPLAAIPSFPPALDPVVYALALLPLLPIVVMPRPVGLVRAWCVFFGLKAATDLSLWQPYFYQYLFMLLALCFAAPGRIDAESAVRDVSRLIVASVYFWSGVGKLNATFLAGGLEIVLGPFLSAPALKSLAPLAVVVPLLEISVALGLVTKRLRRAAAAGAIAMHVLLLLSLGPLGQNANPVVWPWNVAMMLLVWILFVRDASAPASRILWNRAFPFHQLVLVLFGLCPLLALFGLWPTSLSFRLYADSSSWGDILVTEAMLARLPPEARSQVQSANVFLDLPGSKTGKIGPYAGGLSIPDWSEHELRAFLPAEARVFRQVFAKVCRLAPAPSDAVLVLQDPPDLFTGAVRRTAISCAERL